MENFFLQSLFDSWFDSSSRFIQPLLIEAQVLAILVTFWGYGRTFQRYIMGKDLISELSFVHHLVFGIFFGMLVSFIVNFWFPIDARFCSVFILMGLGLAAKESWPWMPKIGYSLIFNILGILILTYAFAFKAIATGVHPDTGIYHLPSITWVHREIVPIGSANALRALAFNSGWTNLVALFWHEALQYGSIFCVNLALLIGTIAYLFQHAVNNRSSRFSLFSSSLALLFLVYLFTEYKGYVLFYEVSSVSNDISSACLAIIAFFTALSALSCESKTQSIALFTTVFLSALLSSLVKLSYAPIMLLPIFLVYARRKMFFPLKESLLTKSFGSIFALSILLVVSWSIKGFLISGCFVYPFIPLCFFEVSWTVYKDHVLWFSDFLKIYARVSKWTTENNLTGEQILHEWSWVGGKISEYLMDWHTKVLLYAFSVGGIFSALTFSFKKARAHFSQQDIRGFLLIFACLILVVSFWFYRSPNPRYAYGSLPLFCLAPIALLFTPMLKIIRARKWMFCSLVALLIAVMSYDIPWSEYEWRTYQDPVQLKWPRLPIAALQPGTPRKTLQGFSYNESVGGLCLAVNPVCSQGPIDDLLMERRGKRLVIVDPYAKTRKR